MRRGRGKQGRQSTCLNDDDFDYAIELKLDDEYRQAAHALPSIAELEDLEDDDLLIMLDDRKQSVEIGLNRRLSSTQPTQRKSIVEYLRGSLSLSPTGSRSRITKDRKLSDDGDISTCVIDVVPSPLNVKLKELEEKIDLNENQNENQIGRASCRERV